MDLFELRRKSDKFMEDSIQTVNAPMLDNGLCESIALQMGFSLDKHYEHDEWETLRYKKGVLQLEFTYRIDNGKIETIDITIDEVVGLSVSENDVRHLDRILNKPKPPTQ